MGGCVCLVIYLIVSGFCLGPAASSQFGHLKLRAPNPQNSSYSIYFGSDPERVNMGGCVSHFIFIIVSSCCLDPEA